MKNNFKKAALAVAFMFAASSSLLAEEVVIGAVLPLSGPLAAFGQTASAGIKLANSMQSTLANGYKIKVNILDNKGDRVETQNAVTRVIDSSGAISIIGALTSTNTMQALQIADQKRIPLVSPTASLDNLLDRSRYGSRVMFKDSFQGTAIANYALGKKIDTAVVIADQAQVYSIGLAKAFSDYYTQEGGKILRSINVTSGDKDFRAILSQIASLKPKMVFLPLYHPEAALIVRQSKEIGLDTIFMAGDGVSNPVYVELGGEAVNGTVYTGSFDAAHPQTELGREFVQAYAKSDNSEDIADFTALGADAYFVIVNAMNRCLDNLTPACINEKLHSTDKFQGVSGIISIDEKGNATRSVVLKKIENGAPVYEYTVNPES